ncbi:MAG: hydrogenase nickel incorporation protein HypB [Betaproteobacteria bacterium]
MCTTCGCASGNVKIEGHEHAHGHDHGHDHGHTHDHTHDHVPDHVHAHGDAHHHHHDHAHGELHYGHGPAHSHAPGMSQEKMVAVERGILDKNNQFARANRRWLAQRGIFALNVVSSPGSGKTTLLVETIKRLAAALPVAVIEGDQQTSNDADRIRATGARAIQINTGKGCHLDASMVEHALLHLAPAQDSVLFIENVGNLVCPAAFDLGEAHKVVVLSVTEGEDKPLKYPDMFAAAQLMVLNKVDLLPYLQFEVDKAIAAARRVNPTIEVLQVSALKPNEGDGMDAWLDWIRAGSTAAREARAQRAADSVRKLALLEEHIATLNR